MTASVSSAPNRPGYTTRSKLIDGRETVESKPIFMQTRPSSSVSIASYATKSRERIILFIFVTFFLVYILIAVKNVADLSVTDDTNRTNQRHLHGKGIGSPLISPETVFYRKGLRQGKNGTGKDNASIVSDKKKTTHVDGGKDDGAIPSTVDQILFLYNSDAQKENIYNIHKSAAKSTFDSDILNGKGHDNNNNGEGKTYLNEHRKADNTLIDDYGRIPFPQSIHNEEWDTIMHPADQMKQIMNDHKQKLDESKIGQAQEKKEETGHENANKNSTDTSKYLKVPRFWDPPKKFPRGVRNHLGNHGDRLITPEEAASIGTTIRAFYEDELDIIRRTDDAFVTAEETVERIAFIDAKDEAYLNYYYQQEDDQLLRNAAKNGVIPPNPIPEKNKLVNKRKRRKRRAFGKSYEFPPDRTPLPPRLRAIIPKFKPDPNDPAGSYTLETIFISIATYRDPRCSHTIDAIFANAAFPERLRVGIIDQIIQDVDDSCSKPTVPCSIQPNQVKCRYANLIDTYTIDAKLSVGPVFARHIGYRLYRGEYFAMQTDAHMEFVRGWDVDLVAQWRSAKNEMAVLTTYVSDVENHFNKTTNERTTPSRPLMCTSAFEEDYYEENLQVMKHGQEPESLPYTQDEPTLEPYWAAGFSFARGHFVIQVPYDQYLPMIFQGEEISIGIRGFTYGYDFYAPQRSVLYHYYNSDPNTKKRKKVASFWENGNLYKGVESASKARLAGVLNMISANVLHELAMKESKIKKTRANTDKDIDEKNVNLNGDSSLSSSTTHPVWWTNIEERKYGIGKIRSVQKFMDTFGIHLLERRVEHHLCDFVGTKMNTEFSKHLREDGMGIDYQKITYKYKDSRPNDVDDLESADEELSESKEYYSEDEEEEKQNKNKKEENPQRQK
mmetsp:Transcript_1683/g.2416  ORF Transcript_1683/g.2416 Transcript_1683/m.2416 type:complete len:896 (-) Transcript_1683:65-2752(-)|eukprot:CAMPEP_0184868118 /NCGR_PEP_ID=MMETSP0580-20130426/29207_1 /TAXON_ID=1118495 /ORGANISM="Dactyliosolen fragilissimus" /LENGTH=895 /DNA_ID=CAMNT_0027368785 /DNA_START=55 /DNA_END=2742 /DNA_ORIENTATION=-